MRRTDPAGGVGSRAIDLGEVLSGEGTSTVSTPSTVGVDNDLAASQTSVTLGATDDEATRRLDLRRKRGDVNIRRPKEEKAWSKLTW